MILSICIPSVIGRESQFSDLCDEINIQVERIGAHDSVELITDVDNKQVSIGAKRNRMYQRCTGTYAVQIDDDDWIDSDYIKKVLKACKTGADCIGYLEHCVMDGVEKYSSFSLKYRQWHEFKGNPDANGITYYRTPFTKTPIKTGICKRVGVKDKRFAEDHDFAKRVYRHLKTEEFINEVMYYYTANTLTRREHNERYGIGNRA